MKHSRECWGEEHNNIWEAIAAANHELSRRILQDQPLPEFGRAESSSISKVYQNGESYYIHSNADSTDERVLRLRERMIPLILPI